MEKYFQYNNSFNLFKTVRELKGKPRKPMNSVIDKNGNKQTNTKNVLQVWKEHFENHLNNSFPHNEDALDNIPNAPETFENCPPPTS